MLSRLHAAEGGRETPRAPLPDAETVEAIITAAFWASLRREEGRDPQISLAFLPPTESSDAIQFERPLSLAPYALARLAPAVERPGIHLGVWPLDDGELTVWGAVRDLPPLCFVLEVVEPGLSVVKVRREDDFSKFGNLAVLDGDEVKILDAEWAAREECPALLCNLLSILPERSESRSAGILLRIALSMRAHRRGGALLVVPSGSTAWRSSIIISSSQFRPA